MILRLKLLTSVQAVADSDLDGAVEYDPSNTGFDVPKHVRNTHQETHFAHVAPPRLPSVTKHDLCCHPTTGWNISPLGQLRRGILYGWWRYVCCSALIDDGFDTSNRSTIHATNYYHGHRMTRTTHIPEAANLAAHLAGPADEDMASIAPQGAFQLVQTVQPQRPPVCNLCVFRVGNNRLCLFRTSSSYHWINVHFRGVVGLARGKDRPIRPWMLTTLRKVRIVALYFVLCPYGCRRHGRPLTFSRRQHLVRHLVERCIVSVSEHMAELIAHKRIIVELRGGWERLVEILEYP